MSNLPAMTATAEAVNAQILGDIGIITLTRTTALNALTTTMVERISAALEEWQNNGLRAVVLQSASPKAFCAGGDIRAIQEYSLAGDHEASERFFASEYELNARIAEYSVPIVSLIDGICMGGGMGLSVHGQFRVLSGKASMAMPETGIGFFPDVGASYFLPRLPGALGMYLGLTGVRISAADAVYAGLATHLINTNTMGCVPEALAGNPDVPVDRVLRSLNPENSAEDCELARQRTHIDWCFSARTLKGIEERLAAVPGPWASATLDTLGRVSPQSLHLAHELLAWGKQRSLRECLAIELQLTRQVIKTPDFIEGVRAALVDKDRAPAWGPSHFLRLSPDGTSVWKL